jgi:hypothetical protein
MKNDPRCKDRKPVNGSEEEIEPEVVVGRITRRGKYRRIMMDCICVPDHLFTNYAAGLKK